MIKLEKTQTYGWEATIRGMRNPMNSWDKSDSNYIPLAYCDESQDYELAEVCNRLAPIIGPNDRTLMMKLAEGGPVHAKFRRMIVVSVDIAAPLYWWKEFDTYKVGTVANSCSTMHKIAEKEFTLEDFSCEHLLKDEPVPTRIYSPYQMMETTVWNLNIYREMYNETKDKKYWWQMIQLLPSSYNQKRTVMLNYEVLAGIYPSRKKHKLDEWHTFCDWIKELPYSEIIIGKEGGESNGQREI